MSLSLSLLSTAAVMGLAGTPHCLAMCGATSQAACGGRAGLPAFHLGRLLSYAAAGAVAAAAVGALARASGAMLALKPLWLLVHLAALALGLYLLVIGRQPGFVERWGRPPAAVAGVDGWRPVRGPQRRAALAGLAWVAWPCGLLQSALLVAAMADRVWLGAATMATFALTSAAGLVLGPWLWLRLQGTQGRHGNRAGTVEALASARPAVRLAGAMLVGASAWAVGHDVITRFVAWCLS